jgi:ribosomal protein S7
LLGRVFTLKIEIMDNIKIEVMVSHTANLGNYENLKIEVSEIRNVTSESQTEEVREALTNELITFVMSKGKAVKKKRKNFIK